MNFDQLLNVSVRLGTMLLENGAEIYRVEESIRNSKYYHRHLNDHPTY